MQHLVPGKIPTPPRRNLLVRALAALFLLSASAWAAPSESVELATDSYLEASEGRHLGMMAASAAGGPKGWLSVRLLAWYPSLTGTGNDDGGGDFDTDADLGLGDNELTIVPQITVDFWIFGWRTDVFNVEFSGDGRIERTFTFGGQTFTIGEDVTSEVKMQNIRSLGLISFLDTDVVRIAAIIGFNYYKIDATITGATTGPANFSGSLPYPVVGLLAQVRISDFLIEAEASGFYVDYGSVQATAIDITVSAAWNFLEFGEVRAGYRFISIDGTIDDTALDIRLDGFFVSVGVTF